MTAIFIIIGAVVSWFVLVNVVYLVFVWRNDSSGDAGLGFFLISLLPFYPIYRIAHWVEDRYFTPKP